MKFLEKQKIQKEIKLNKEVNTYIKDIYSNIDKDFKAEVKH